MVWTQETAHVKKVQEASPPPPCLAGAGSSEVGKRWTNRRDDGISGLGSAANRALHTPPLTSLKSVLSMKTMGPKGT